VEDVYIIGVSCTPFGKQPQRSFKDLSRQAYLEALADAGLADGGQIEQAWFGNCGMGSFGQRNIRGQVCFTPLVAFSASVDARERQALLRLGFDECLAKPVNPVLLKARISSSLEKKRLRDQQKALISRFATSQVAQDLQQSGFALGGRRVQASVMFCDLRGFTRLAESQPPEETIELLNTWYTLMFDAIAGQGGVVNQMIGDGLMAMFGAPAPVADAPLAAARAALDMAGMIDLLNAERAAQGQEPISMGIGIASGEVIAGYTGTRERATYTCVGDTVNLAARLEQHTKACGHDILLDAPTCAAIGGRIASMSLGEVALRGKAAPVAVHALTPP